MPWFVYVVRCRDGSLYTGVSTDVDGRVAVHNAGRGARYTRSRRPVTLVHVERKRSRSTALKRELAIKALSREAKLALVAAGPYRRGASPTGALRSGVNRRGASPTGAWSGVNRRGASPTGAWSGVNRRGASPTGALRAATSPALPRGGGALPKGARRGSPAT